MPRPPLVVADSLVMVGQISMITALGTSIAANIVCYGAWFVAGRFHGYRVMKQLCRISLWPDSCVRQSESLITRWGGRSFIAAKFVPGVSIIAAPMAGALGMSATRFLVFEVVAAVVWTLAFMALGTVFSDPSSRSSTSWPGPTAWLQRHSLGRRQTPASQSDPLINWR